MSKEIKAHGGPVAYWNGGGSIIAAEDVSYLPNWSDYYPIPLYTSPAIPEGWQLMDMGWLASMLHVNAMRMFPEKSHEEIALEIDRLLSSAPKKGATA